MDFTTLPVLKAYDWLPADLDAERIALETELAKLTERRSKLESALQAVSQTDIDTVDYDDLKRAEAARKERFQLLQDELKLRQNRLAAYFKAVQAAARQRHRQLQTELPEIEAEIQAGLEKLGYLPPPSGGTIAGQWDVSFLRQHPRHIANRWEQDRLRNVSGDLHPTQQNDASVTALRVSLESFRRALSA